MRLKEVSRTLRSQVRGTSKIKWTSKSDASEERNSSLKVQASRGGDQDLKGQSWVFDFVLVI